MGITTEQAVEWEVQSLAEAIGNCIELNNEFLDSFCSAELAEVMKAIPEVDREFILADHIGEGKAVGYYGDSGDIFLNVSELEIQIESEEDLEDPEDWTIDGDLAYCYVGAGIAFDVDITALKADIADWYGKAA